MKRAKKMPLTIFEVGFISSITVASALPWWFGEEEFKYSLLFYTVCSIAGTGILLAIAGVWRLLDNNSRDVGRRQVALRPLVKLTDWIPSKKLRQRIRTLIAEDQSDIRRLRKSGRMTTARWREICAWLIVAWYVVLAPLVGLKALFVGAFALLGHWTSK